MLERQKAQRQYRTYTFRELEAATDSFSPAKLLGEGGFGQVYLGRLEHTPAAIKILNQEGLQVGYSRHWYRGGALLHLLCLS